MKTILTDTTKCIGCRECVIACRKANRLEADVPRRWMTDDGLSARNWTSIVEKPGRKFIRKQCRHCLHPACVASCPVGALQKNAVGAVVYDSSKCMGCRYCMVACPYGIPRYDWDQTVPYVRKCILCAERLQQGDKPACTEACPTQATIFGEREELIQVARQRLQDHPQSYIQTIWGEKEVGGTQVLYISDVNLSFLTHGQALGEKPLPTLTAPAMHAVPFTFVGVGAVLAGVNWIIGRRRKLMKDQPPESEEKPDE